MEYNKFTTINYLLSTYIFITFINNIVLALSVMRFVIYTPYYIDIH